MDVCAHTHTHIHTRTNTHTPAMSLTACNALWHSDTHSLTHTHTHTHTTPHQSLPWSPITHSNTLTSEVTLAVSIPTASISEPIPRATLHGVSLQAAVAMPLEISVYRASRNSPETQIGFALLFCLLILRLSSGSQTTDECECVCVCVCVCVFSSAS